MPIDIGQQLGTYEITALLGRGGMGEVYRARDTKLKRDVAIKILPDEFLRDSNRITRFQREAEVLAALNHPNIAAIYDFQEASEARFLVLEVVEGETLAERIVRGPLAIEDAIDIAKHICEALEAAHEKGIVHRDLKPANVKITPEGRVKVLDFGLAKAMEDPQRSTTLSNSPTLTLGGTQAGVILGTASYMSPEQAKGFQADTRSDVFSFGALLFEMLTGRQAFPGETVGDILASVIAREPDLNLLPPNLNPRLQELLQRCLQKNPKRRWQAVGDLRTEIETIAALPRVVTSSTQKVPSPQRFWRLAVPIAVTAVLFSVAASIVTWTLKPTAPGNVVRFSITLPESQVFSSSGSRQIAVSPDGTRLAYVANNEIYIRKLDEVESQPISGTNGQIPSSPFFSPDGQWLGFYSRQDGAFKKISIYGGVPQIICKENGRNADWAGDQIVFSSAKGIMRAPAQGGNAELLVPAKSPEDTDNPQIIDDGRLLLFTLATETGADRWDKAQIVVQSLETGKRSVLLTGSSARYIPTGHLVYALAGTLFAVPFDLKTLQVNRAPLPVVPGVTRANSAVSGVAMFGLSRNGSLVYIPGNPEAGFSNAGLAFVDSKGEVHSLPLQAALYRHPRVSPDGTQVLFVTDTSKDASFISIYDLKAGGSPRRMTFGATDSSPIWFPDGTRIAFESSNREGGPGIFWQPAAGGTAERLTKPEAGVGHRPDSWTRDGKILSFTAVKGVQDLWTVSMDGDRKPALLLSQPRFSLRTSEFSPDNHWFAYDSTEAGHSEIYIQPFPPTGAKYQISSDSGAWPRWSPDGKRVYYVEPSTNRLLSVDIHTEPSFGFGKPIVIPIPREQITLTTPNGGRNYDITPDGKQFLVVMRHSTGNDVTSRQAEQINVVLNWYEELKQRVPLK